MFWPIALVQFVLVHLTLLSGPVWADLKAGLEAYDRGDFSKAFEEWHPLARQGLADAQFQLGHLYDQGKGVAKDSTKASCWYRLSFRWFEKDAESGNAWSQFRLGVQYDQGLGVEVDKHAASHWYRLAAEQGNPSAQYQVGYMYALGEGMNRDYLQAYKWATLADANGSKFAGGLKTQAAAHLSREQMAEAQRLADEWTPARTLKDLSPFLEEEAFFDSEEEARVDCESSSSAGSATAFVPHSPKGENPALPTPSPTVLSHGPEAPLTNEDGVVLEIEAQELSWVIVQSDHHFDARKEILLQPGQRMGWTASKFFVVTLGNAGGVDLYVNGEGLKKFGGRGQIIRNKILKPEHVQPKPLEVSGKRQYLAVVQTVIDRHWVVPPVQEGKLISILKFRVENSGLISDIAVEKGSGNEHYDSAARRAIQAVNPLPPFPQNMPQAFVEVKYRFRMK